jgi:hypothetical protein
MENNFNNQETSKVEEPAIKAPEVVEETVVEEEVKPEPVVEEKVEDVIKAPAYSAPVEQVPALAPVANGAIGTGTADKPAKKVSAPKQDKEKTVAIKSTKNVTWIGVGKVSKGINIVSEAAAAEWLTRDHVTKVEAEEVAKEFGK